MNQELEDQGDNFAHMMRRDIGSRRAVVHLRKPTFGDRHPLLYLLGGLVVISAFFALVIGGFAFYEIVTAPIGAVS